MTTAVTLTADQRRRLEAARARSEEARETALVLDDHRAWEDADRASRDLARLAEALGVNLTTED